MLLQSMGPAHVVQPDFYACRFTKIAIEMGRHPWSVRDRYREILLVENKNKGEHFQKVQAVTHLTTRVPQSFGQVSVVGFSGVWGAAFASDTLASGGSAIQGGAR
jgi:hypothetical protein